METLASNSQDGRDPMTKAREFQGIETIVLHSGGMDSSLCLAQAVKDYGAPHVLSLGFDYGQRHANELASAKRSLERLQRGH